MENLKHLLSKKIDEHRPRTTRLLKEFGDVVMDKVTIGQAIGGMRSVKILVTDISYLDPEEGIRYRGKTLPEVFNLMPKPKGKDYPYVEGLWYFLLTGEIPSESEVLSLVEEFKKRRAIPKYVKDVLHAAPKDLHPMSLLSIAVLAMQKESKFVKFYNEGYDKNTSWEYMFEDATNIISKLPGIAAYIYRMKYKNNKHFEDNNDLDMAGNFAHLMGIPEPYDDVSRMYFIVHADHESGNVSAHSTHLIASALSDAYYSISGMLNGLAGPLHGLANQEVLRWIQDVKEKMGNKVPSVDEMKKFVWDTLNSGSVIPGYGHAVLRKTDPRYTVQRNFCLKHLPNDELFKYVDILYQVVPDILREQGKAKNPWPNVDAQSGVIQWYYGVTEYDFYTVMFGVGRAIGTLANITWDRALGYPIERPKSLTTEMVEKIAGIK